MNATNAGIIERFEILKMASTVATVDVSKAPKTYMTHTLAQNHLNIDSLWMFRSKIIQRFKMEHCFD